MRIFRVQKELHILGTRFKLVYQPGEVLIMISESPCQMMRSDGKVYPEIHGLINDRSYYVEIG